jgi:cytochrome c2
MSPRLILFFILLVSAQLAFSIDYTTGPLKVSTPSTTQKIKQEEEHKLLVAAYDTLSDAIAADDLTAVEKLFKETPNLKNYAHHNEGTPLHFARSQAMTQLLVEKIGFDANICDEWGELPSQTIRATKDQFFAHPQEKPLIATYLTSREARFAKIYYQLKNNKNIHRRAAVTALTAMLIGLDYHLYHIVTKI